MREYVSADYSVLSTYSENFGSVVIKALAYYVPVICTKSAPLEELETYKCGWWIDIGVEPLRKALYEALLLDEITLHEMGLEERLLLRQNMIEG